MKSLKDILYGTSIVAVQGSTEANIGNITFDSRTADSDSLFVAIKGTVTDGHNYIDNVIAQGCTNILISDNVECPENVNVIQSKDTKEALGIIASNFYNNPSRELELIGVTGTNGKTTTTTLLHNVFTQLGYHTGLLSTIVNKIGSEEIKSTHTTPDPIQLNFLLRKMVDDGVTHCFMEVSSHAIDQRRIAGLQFRGGAFTNITHDHLDYHNTFKEYIQAKKRFFDDLSSDAFALTNHDDKNGMVMLQNTKATKKTFALKSHADYNAKILENLFSGLVISINGQEVWTRLVGEFNAYNILTVFGIADQLNEDMVEVLTVISELKAVEGRFEFVQNQSNVSTIVDYAHTPDALENVLKTIATIRTKNEQLITVVGCGGDRDKAKRPKMADVACQFSDKVIFTSDNPRSEDPNTIIEEMEKGVEPIHFKKTLSITDRKQAIKSAVMMSEPGDIILIAGKGHEKYQEINGVKHDFDDIAIVTELLKQIEVK